MRFSLITLLSVIALVTLPACGADVEQYPAPNGINAGDIVAPENGSTTSENTASVTDTAVLSPELSDELKRGKSLYRANGCEVCHGVQGKGDGPAGTGMVPPPRNLLDVSSYKQGASEAQIVRTLYTGVPGTLMNAYRHIKAEDRVAIARYILHLRETAE